MLCSPWIDSDTITQCSLDVDKDGTVEEEDMAKVDRAVLVASSLLYAATARRYPGICTDSIRPCTATGLAQAIDYPANIGGARILPVTSCGCYGCLTIITCDGLAWPAVELPGTPVVDVLEVTVDGAPFTAFRIVDDRYLIRNDRGPWPARNDLGADITEPGTWAIEYRYGAAPEPDLAAACEVLACELLASWCTTGDCGDCHLPKRLQSLTYEGATAAVLDPFDFLDSGGFGIASVDFAVRAANPENLQRVGKLASPSDMARRVYRVRP